MRRAFAAAVLAVGLAVSPISTAWAASLSSEASQTRTDVIALTRDYSQQYGSKVTPSERAELEGMVREARTEMNTLVRLIRAAERTNRTSNWRRAHSHYLDIRATGDQRLAEVREIIGPKMSFADQIDAWSQARSVMKDLDSLGAKLEQRSR